MPATTYMARTADDLATVLTPLAERFSDIHPVMASLLAEFMRPDGSIEFTVRALTRKGNLSFGRVSAYLRAARELSVLHLLGRRSEGALRYCAYLPATEATRPDLTAATANTVALEGKSAL